MELIGADYNRALVDEATRLAVAESLVARFVNANVFALEEPATVFVSTGVIHHFRGEALVAFLRQHEQPRAAAFLHFDFQPSRLPSRWRRAVWGCASCGIPSPHGRGGRWWTRGSRMLAVYLPYTAVILIAFAIRALPSVDVRSLTSTLVFGPLTLLRPLVAVAGLGWVLSSRSWLLAAVGVGVLTLMLSMERFLGRRHPAVA